MVTMRRFRGTEVRGYDIAMYERWSVAAGDESYVVRAPDGWAFVPTSCHGSPQMQRDWCLQRAVEISDALNRIYSLPSGVHDVDLQQGR